MFFKRNHLDMHIYVSGLEEYSFYSIVYLKVSKKKKVKKEEREEAVKLQLKYKVSFISVQPCLFTN